MSAAKRITEINRAKCKLTVFALNMNVKGFGGKEVCVDTHTHVFVHLQI